MRRTVLLIAMLVALAGQANAQGTTFKVRVENVSAGTVLRDPRGATAPVAIAPTLWIVHTERAPIFSEGRPDRGQGLEALAEDGNPEPLAKAVEHRSGVLAAGVANGPIGGPPPSSPGAAYGPLLPGAAYEFTIVAPSGARLTTASMFGQSNDLFYAPREEGIALFADGEPVSGDVTSQIVLWDAGTELNELPGFGPNQAPRQPHPNTGPAEHGVVHPVKDRFVYPAVGRVLRITITPQR